MPAAGRGTPTTTTFKTSAPFSFPPSSHKEHGGKSEHNDDWAPMAAGGSRARNDTESERKIFGEPDRIEVMNRAKEAHPSFIALHLQGRKDFPLTKFCKPVDTCAATGGPKEFTCLENFPITPEMVGFGGGEGSIRGAGSSGKTISIRAELENSLKTACQVTRDGVAYDVYITYRLRAGSPNPVPAPSPVPTSASLAYPVVHVNMNMTGLAADAAVTPDVRLAIVSAMHQTLNVSNVPAMTNVTILVISQPVITILNPLPIANLTLPNMTAQGIVAPAAAAVADRKLTAVGATPEPVATVQMTVTISSSTDDQYRSANAVQGLVATFYPANLNATSTALGLGLNLGVKNLATTTMMSPPQGGTAAPTPSQAAMQQGDSGSAQSYGGLIGGVIAGVVIIGGVAVYFGSRAGANKSKPLSRADAAEQLANAQQWQTASLPAIKPRTSTTQSPWSRESSGSHADDIPARLSHGNAQVQQPIVSARGSTMVTSVNPLLPTERL